MLFDALEIAGKELTHVPLSKRREALEKFFARNEVPRLHLSPVTHDRRTAVDWLEHSGGALDGVIAKRSDLEYRSGERAMIKVKQQRTADCVVGGFRYAEKKNVVGSLLLGLYDDEGKLNHVGFTSAIPAKDRPQLTKAARSTDRAAGLHRKRAWRPKPVEQRTVHGVGAAEARTGLGGPL